MGYLQGAAMKTILTDLSFDPGKGFSISHFQDDIPIIEQNEAEKMLRSNGFSGKRLMRKVASIPTLAVTMAEREGYNMSDAADVKDYLRKHPEYMTVKKFDTGHNGRVIVK